MAAQTTLSNSGNFIKLPNDAIDDLLLPISKKALADRIALLKGWKASKPYKAKQNKREYFKEHLARSFTLGMLRDLRILREHCLIGEFQWRLYSWDKSIARYYPNKISNKLEEIIYDLASMVNIDYLVVDEEAKTVFLLLEQWQNEVVANTFLSKVETNIPKYFRAYLFLDKKMILVQEKSEQATKDFIGIFEQAFKIVTEEIRINAMVVRSFVLKAKGKITRIVIRVPQEVAGFGGLSELTLVGSDVIHGSQGLMNRHEASPIDVGPWTGTSNKNIDLDVGKPLKTRSIKETHWLLDLISDLV